MTTTDASDEPKGWRCSCGEAHSDAFDQCWNCRSSRQGTAETVPLEDVEAEQVTASEESNSDRDDWEIGDSLGDLDLRRRVIGMLRHGKYAKPFEKGRFAYFSVMGTNDWQDSADLVVQMVIADTLLNIEAALVRPLSTRLEELDKLAADGTISQDEYASARRRLLEAEMP